MTKIPSQVNKYWAIFQIQLTNKFTYPIDLLSRSLMIAMFMWIFSQLWHTTYSASGQEIISGLSINHTMWYLMFAETIILSQPNIAIPISENVKDGSIAYLLSKPYDFLLYQFSVGLGDTILQLIANIISGGLVVWSIVGPPPGGDGILMGFAAMALAMIINFTMNAMIGMLAFITEDVTAFMWIYNKFILLLGGVLIPLDFFPDWLKSLSLKLPFAYAVYGPARLFVKPEMTAFINLITSQILWILILTIFLIWMFRIGTAKLVINGG
ncbi:MAG: ABC-2 family transporter protein [Chloroflexota bacterium]